MQRIFGVQKQKDPPPSIGDATDRISKRGENVDEKIKRLDSELARYKERIKKTRPGPSQDAVKARAMRVLKQKRIYGVILDNIQKQDPLLTVMIKGCIVDSVPVASQDPQVWASGFSAALFKKQRVATKGSPNLQEPPKQTPIYTVVEQKPAATETALLVVLEKLFKVILNFPSVNRRLSDVMGLLLSNQPKCPQLYIYSSADRVIPAQSVESFIDEQRRSGHEVRACNFVSSPHVDHFRVNPKLYKVALL